MNNNEETVSMSRSELEKLISDIADKRIAAWERKTSLGLMGM